MVDWATFGEYGGDGKLDLFVAGYVHFDRNNLPYAGSKALGGSDCVFRGVNVMCGLRGLRGQRDDLFHNNGDGTFEDASLTSGYAFNQDGREIASMVSPSATRTKDI